MQRRQSVAIDEPDDEDEEDVWSDGGEDVVRVFYPMRRGEDLALSRRELTLPRQRGTWLDAVDFIKDGVAQLKAGRQAGQRAVTEFLRTTQEPPRIGAAVNASLAHPEEDFCAHLLPKKSPKAKKKKKPAARGGGVRDIPAYAPTVPLLPIQSVETPEGSWLSPKPSLISRRTEANASFVNPLSEGSDWSPGFAARPPALRVVSSKLEATHKPRRRSKRVTVQDVLQVLVASGEYHGFFICTFWWFFLEHYATVLLHTPDEEKDPLLSLPAPGRAATGEPAAAAFEAAAKKGPLHVKNASAIKSWMRSAIGNAQATATPRQRTKRIKARSPRAPQTARLPAPPEAAAPTARGGRARSTRGPLVIPPAVNRIASELPDVVEAKPTFFLTTMGSDEEDGSFGTRTQGSYWSNPGSPDRKHASFVNDTEGYSPGRDDGVTSPPLSESGRRSGAPHSPSLRDSVRAVYKRASRRTSRCSSVASARSFLAALAGKNAQAEEEDGLTPEERRALQTTRQEELVGRLSGHYVRLVVRVQGMTRGVGNEGLAQRILLDVLPDLTSFCVDSALRDALPYALEQIGGQEASTMHISKQVSYWLLGVERPSAQHALAGAKRAAAQKAQTKKRAVGLPTTTSNLDLSQVDAVDDVVSIATTRTDARTGKPPFSPRGRDASPGADGRPLDFPVQPTTNELLRELKSELDAVITDGRDATAAKAVDDPAASERKYASRGGPKPPLPWYETGRPPAYVRQYARPETGFFTLTDKSPMLTRYFAQRRGAPPLSVPRPGEMNWMC
eukprot:TRINITY_DN2657_c0_g2_i3.p1 TRINITY_DN2657_c0_g2~~TRINITY_DN2657_c0_g2_i3.p1  ORF type:complete len:788 (+),score=280.70 TRINITY_DN2657_c0_g2_i3:91-2454(+)